MTTHFNATRALTFAEALTVAYTDPNSPHVRESVSEPMSVFDGDYNGAEFYVSEDHRSGFAVKANGELCLVFSTVKGRGADLMRHAIYRGATQLDCFEGFLPTFYAKHGFVEVGSEQNWGGAHLPRVVYMALGDAHV